MPVHQGHDLRISADFAKPWMPGPVTGPVTQDVFTGTEENDKLTGTNADDQFDMGQGGNDRVKGGKGDDAFDFAGTLTAADRIDGGLDSGDPFIGTRDLLILDGDYSAGVVFAATTMVNVESMWLNAGNSYDITFNDATVNAAEIFRIDLVGHWSAGDNFTFDGSAETDGSFEIEGGRGRDVLTGGANGDQFNFGRGELTAIDRIDGGPGGFDTIILDGDYSNVLNFDADTIKNIDVIYMYGGNDYGLKLNDGNVAAGETLTVSGAFLEAEDSLMVNGSAERDGFLTLYGGDANDLLIGGRRGDYIQGNEGGDTLNGGKGRDTFGYSGGPNESQGGNYDTIVGFNFDAADAFDMTFEVTGIDTVGNGTLSFATFVEDLKAAVNGNLLAHEAVLFTPDAGDLSGDVFLVIDADGKNGYKSAVDYVIHLQESANLAQLDVGDFI